MGTPQNPVRGLRPLHLHSLHGLLFLHEGHPGNCQGSPGADGLLGRDLLESRRQVNALSLTHQAYYHIVYRS